MHFNQLTWALNAHEALPFLTILASSNFKNVNYMKHAKLVIWHWNQLRVPGQVNAGLDLGTWTKLQTVTWQRTESTMVTTGIINFLWPNWKVITKPEEHRVTKPTDFCLTLPHTFTGIILVSSEPSQCSKLGHDEDESGWLAFT